MECYASDSRPSGRKKSLRRSQTWDPSTRKAFNGHCLYACLFAHALGRCPTLREILAQRAELCDQWRNEGDVLADVAEAEQVTQSQYLAQFVKTGWGGILEVWRHEQVCDVPLLVMDAWGRALYSPKSKPEGILIHGRGHYTYAGCKATCMPVILWKWRARLHAFCQASQQAGMKRGGMLSSSSTVRLRSRNPAAASSTWQRASTSSEVPSRAQSVVTLRSRAERQAQHQAEHCRTDGQLEEEMEMMHNGATRCLLCRKWSNPVHCLSARHLQRLADYRGLTDAQQLTYRDEERKRACDHF